MTDDEYWKIRDDLRIIIASCKGIIYYDDVGDIPQEIAVSVARRCADIAEKILNATYDLYDRK